MYPQRITQLLETASRAEFDDDGWTDVERSLSSLLAIESGSGADARSLEMATRDLEDSLSRNLRRLRRTERTATGVPGRRADERVTDIITRIRTSMGPKQPDPDDRRSVEQ
jgi:hypothetical protein